MEPATPPVLEPIALHAAGHDWLLFVESPAYIEALLADIRAARRRIWIEVYIFEKDRAGQAVAEALKERARAGLDVRLLYDAIGCQPTPGSFFADMARAGVQVHEFHSLWEALWRFAPLQILNRRDHRKLAVIDEIAYFGGMNLTDPLTVQPGARRRRSTASAAVDSQDGWRDLHVRLTGPQVPEVAESFERSWRRARREPVGPRSPSYRQGLLAGGEESLQFFDSGPGKRYSNVGRVFGQLFRQARARIDIAMAYFLPVLGVRRALVQARRRGVRIRLVIPGISDVQVVRRATRYLYRGLLRRGFRVYERQRNMLHSKVVVVDDQWSVIGSANLDPRSLLLNYEFMAVVHSRTLALKLRKIIEQEKAHSRPVTRRQARSLPWEERFLDGLAYMVRWWL